MKNREEGWGESKRQRNRTFGRGISKGYFFFLEIHGVWKDYVRAYSRHAIDLQTGWSAYKNYYLKGKL